MLSAILFAIAISGAYFFTVVPWFLAAGGDFWRASPFIAVSVIVASLLGRWYQRGLRSERVSPTAGRRRRLAFAIALLVTAIPVAGIALLGIKERLRDGSNENIQSASVGMTETQLEVERLEDRIAEQQRAKDRGELSPYDDRLGQLRSEVKRRREVAARYIDQWNDAKVARRNGWIAAFGTVVYVAACIAAAARSFRWRPAQAIDPVAGDAL